MLFFYERQFVNKLRLKTTLLERPLLVLGENNGSVSHFLVRKPSIAPPCYWTQSRHQSKRGGRFNYALERRNGWLNFRSDRKREKEAIHRQDGQIPTSYFPKPPCKHKCLSSTWQLITEFFTGGQVPLPIKQYVADTFWLPKCKVQGKLSFKSFKYHMASSRNKLKIRTMFGNPVVSSSAMFVTSDKSY